MLDWTKLEVPGATLCELNGCPVVLAPDKLSATSAITGAPVVVGRLMREGTPVDSREEFVKLVEAGVARLPKYSPL